MSKLTIDISIEFRGEGHEREGLCVNITPNNKTLSNEEIADIVREEVFWHLEKYPAGKLT